MNEPPIIEEVIHPSGWVKTDIGPSGGILPSNDDICLFGIAQCLTKTSLKMMGKYFDNHRTPFNFILWDI